MRNPTVIRNVRAMRDDKPKFPPSRLTITLIALVGILAIAIAEFIRLSM